MNFNFNVFSSPGLEPGHESFFLLLGTTATNYVKTAIFDLTNPSRTPSQVCLLPTPLRPPPPSPAPFFSWVWDWLAWPRCEDGRGPEPQARDDPHDLPEGMAAHLIGTPLSDSLAASQSGRPRT